MDIRFDGQVTLVTGASTGIGAATAIKFARSGASVVVNYNRSKNAANQVISTIEAEGGNAIAIQADVTKTKHVERLVATTRDSFGDRIDILVNNAGSLVERCTLENMSEALWDEVINLNLKSVFLCTHAVLPIMKKNGFGRIINVSSIAARNGGGPGTPHYAAAKAGVLTLTKNLAKQLANDNITVNNVAPGIITTPFHDQFSTPEIRQGFLERIPLGREGSPEEVAYSILFLASKFADYITGETIEINGGMLMD